MRISVWSSDVCSSDLGRTSGRRAVCGSANAEAATALGALQVGDPLEPAVEVVEADENPDLIAVVGAVGLQRGGDLLRGDQPAVVGAELVQGDPERRGRVPGLVLVDRLREGDGLRSEEHTSEIQSLMRHSSAVFFFKK